MMNILFAGFEGRSNSSKILLDRLNCDNKLYLKNNKILSCKQIEKALKSTTYDYVLLFGQKPNIKNKLCIEKFAKINETSIETEFDLVEFSNRLSKHKFRHYISHSAGCSYCNHIYYFTLNHIKNNNLNTKALFIHLPYIKNFDSIQDFEQFINQNLKEKI